MDRSRIAIIIPALNEEATIQDVIRQVMPYGVPIVVDDGSTDDTAEIVKLAGAELVKHAFNQGYDGALNSGFSYAGALDFQYVITIDADGQHKPEQLIEFIRFLDEGYELVLGVRDRMPRISELIFARLSKVLWGISDPLCGMKAYHINTYKRLGAFSTFQSIGTELAVATRMSGVSFHELPIHINDRLDKPRFGSILSANLRILKAASILVCRAFVLGWK